MGLHSVSRRQFLGMATAAVALPAVAAPAPLRGADFSFIFLTDSHTQPELDAVHGTDMAMRAASKIRADFAIQGGDHIMDALAVSKEKALQNFSLYDKTEQDLGLKVHHTLGNHDVFGISTSLADSDPLYGKKMFEQRFGSTYYTFNHKGVHFIVLDSIGITGPADARTYQSSIDDAQLAWLTQDLAALTPGAPVIVVTHIPLVTAVPAYTIPPHDGNGFRTEGFVNGPAVINLLTGHNVLGVLQGHTHVNETVIWRGVPFITSGAVCGNWWHGTRLGTPEGFTVATVSGGRLTTRYVPTGFQSVAPQNT